ncbi:MAG: glycoside hydrolase family 27 protein [Treponema sp.]|nr:glycoside hydrolase family 27 protein [Treponema sp.]
MKPEKNAAGASVTLAAVPPMGWNSWDCFAAAVTEAQLLENAAYMRDRLLPFGWEYLVCDVQWYEPLAGTGRGEYVPFAELCMDSCSRLVPAENRFPSAAGGRGFAPIAEKIHGMGLKFGVHLMRGIPRQAVHARMPVTGVGISADRIADPSSICKWNSDMYGVDASKPGAQDYYDSVFALFASWGIDFVKVDDICNTNMYPHAPYSGRAEIEMIHKAIAACGRPMVLSLSPGPAPIGEAWHLAEHANMWRITDDFWDRWDLLKDMFRRCELWQTHGGPGSWPDCDMLPLGRIGMGFRQPRHTLFTRDEQRTMLTLWCIFRSPLIMGGSLPETDEWTLSLLTNRAVLDVLIKGSAPRQIRRTDQEAIWRSTAEDGAVNLALFNIDDTARTVSCPLAALGLKDCGVLDLWSGAALGVFHDRIEAALPPHGAALFRLNGKDS